MDMDVGVSTDVGVSMDVSVSMDVLQVPHLSKVSLEGSLGRIALACAARVRRVKRVDCHGAARTREHL